MVSEFEKIRKKIMDLYEDIKPLYEEMDTLYKADQLDKSQLIYYLNIEAFKEKLSNYDKYLLKQIFEILNKEV